MNQEFNTIELARLYDEQGHVRDALTIYKGLAGQITEDADPEIIGEINKAIERLEPALSSFEEKEQENGPEARLSSLLRQWLMLMVLEKRVSLLKQVKNRV